MLTIVAVCDRCILHATFKRGLRWYDVAPHPGGPSGVSPAMKTLAAEGWCGTPDGLFCPDCSATRYGVHALAAA